MINFTENNEVIRQEDYTAITVGIEIKESIEKSMEELLALASAAQVNVIAEMVQKKEKPNTATFIGKGKLQELSEMAKNMDVNLIIFNDELTGIQLRNIEEAVKVKVIDRTTLILDIFAKRAISAEGKLQVEYAQLKYRLPRLLGLGTGLSKLGGGIGTRGPGEKKLETDRRHIQSRMDEIKKQLFELRTVRETQRAKRQKNKIPIVSLVGYTNSGKSALMNKILEITERDEKQVFEKDMLFATLDTAQRLIKLKDGYEFILIDTVGFVSKLPHSLVNAFKSTLEEVLYSDLIVNVLDMSNKDYEFKLKVTKDVLKEIGVKDKKEIIVFNKKDIAYGAIDFPKLHFEISAKTGEGVEVVLQKIQEILFEERRRAKLLVPFDRGDIVSYLREKAKVENVEYLNEGTLITAFLEEDDYGRLKNYDTLQDGNR